MLLPRVLLIVATIVFVIAAIICHLVAFSTSYWLRSSNPQYNNFLNVGLWVGCFDGFTHKHETGLDGNQGRVYNGCHYLDSEEYKTIRDWLVPSWLVACRILSIIALILIAVTLVLILFLLLFVICEWLCCRRSDNCCERFIIYATPIMMILAGLFEMMTAMVFADNAFKLQCKDFWLGKDEPYSNHLSYSWGFEISACILSFISGGLIIWLAVVKGRDYAYKVVG